MRFKYVQTLPPEGEPNVIFITSGHEEYIFIDGTWECLGMVENQEPEPEPIRHKTYPTNCKNCGAVLKSATCEYCGTTYETRPQYEYDGAGRVLLKVRDDLNAEEIAMMKREIATHRNDPILLYSDNIVVGRL